MSLISLALGQERTTQGHDIAQERIFLSYAHTMPVHFRQSSLLSFTHTVLNCLMILFFPRRVTSRARAGSSLTEYKQRRNQIARSPFTRPSFFSPSLRKCTLHQVKRQKRGDREKMASLTRSFTFVPLTIFNHQLPGLHRRVRIVLCSF